MTDQTGHVVAVIRDTQIFANDIGIYVEQQDSVTARTTSTIVANNIFANRGSGVHLKTSYQGAAAESDGLPFRWNHVHRNAVLPAEQNVCTSFAGASQSAAQIVLDGPIAAMDPSFAPEAGPDPDQFPEDHACYWGPEPGDSPIDTEVACNDVNAQTSPFGVVIHHCIWNGAQCRVAWEFGDSTNDCVSGPKHIWIFNYVNDVTKPEVTQRGITALNGALVRARGVIWGVGGSLDGIATDTGNGSLIDVGSPCGVDAFCVGYDEIPRN